MNGLKSRQHFIELNRDYWTSIYLVSQCSLIAANCDSYFRALWRLRTHLPATSDFEFHIAFARYLGRILSPNSWIFDWHCWLHSNLIYSSSIVIWGASSLSWSLIALIHHGLNDHQALKWTAWQHWCLTHCYHSYSIAALDLYCRPGFKNVACCSTLSDWSKSEESQHLHHEKSQLNVCHLRAAGLPSRSTTRWRLIGSDASASQQSAHAVVYRQSF